MQLRLLLVKGEYNTLILQWVLSINHMWMAPACEGVKFCSGDLVGCGHMSGPFARRIWPLALMKFAERVPIKTTR
jgi:hypothetical protein